jgi:hypothetical protein
VVLSHTSLAAVFLYFMSCLNPRNIPRSLLPTTRAEKWFMHAIETLDAHAFISKHKDNRSFDLRQEVHEAIRGLLSGKDQLMGWTEAAVTRLADVFPPHNYENKRLWTAYFPHARYIMASDSVNKTAEETFRLQRIFARCLFADGKFEEAEKIRLEILERRWKTQDPLGPRIPKRINGVAETLDKKGKREEAKEMGIPALEEKMNGLGAESPDTLTSMAELASLYRSQGRWKEAEAPFMQAMGGMTTPSPTTSGAASATALPRKPFPSGMKQLYASKNGNIAEYVLHSKPESPFDTT